MSSANCWCDNKGFRPIYCTPCEIIIDLMERVEYLEDLVKKNIKSEGTPQ